jgi:two-component system response regulator (stage 0 sporulation protein F)
MLQPRDSRAARGGNGSVGAPVERAHEELVSEVAHVFRTPLGVITGYVELLQLRDDPALRADALPRIEGAARRLGEAIDRLLSALDYEDRAFAERLLDPRPIHSQQPHPSATPSIPRELRVVHHVGVKRIVIVDDDDDVRELLLRTLPRDGFEMLEARDGQEALTLVEREAPDLLLLDWHMPNATGGDVLAELARQKRSVPVIVLTAYDDPQLREIAETHGVAAFLVKPFSPIELLRAIERLLG